MKPVRACSVMSDSLQSLGLQPSRLLCAWNFPEKNDGVVAIFFSSDFPDPEMEPIHRKSGRFLFCLQDLQSDLTAALKGCHSLFHGANLIVQYPFANKIRSGIRLLQHRKRSAEIPGRYTYQRLKGSAEMA